MGPRQPCRPYDNVCHQLAIEQQTTTEFDSLQKQFESHGNFMLLIRSLIMRSM